MDLVMTVVWYPWTEGAAGPAATRGAFRNLFRELEDAQFERLPQVGELIFFDDGGAAAVETVGWKIDGTPYLYLGQRYEKKGEPLELWSARGFQERDAPQQDEASGSESVDAAAPTKPLAAEGESAPPMPGS